MSNKPIVTLSVGELVSQTARGGDIHFRFSGRSNVPEAGSYELIEVKGPGDKLQQNQIRWFNYFQQQGLPARVVSVSWQQADVQGDEKMQLKTDIETGLVVGDTRVE